MSKETRIEVDVKQVIEGYTDLAKYQRLRIRDLFGTLKSEREARVELERQLEAMAESSQKQRDRIEDQSHESGRTIRSLQKVVEDLEGRCNRAEEEVESLKIRHRDDRAYIDQLEGRLESQSATIGRWRVEQWKYKRTISNLKGQITKLKKRMR